MSDTKPLLPLTANGLALSDQGRRLIGPLDLHLTAGPATVILGPNGAGKSLLLHMLHGLRAPSSGRLMWNGTAADLSTRRRTSLVLQSPVLLRRSVQANIDFVLKARGAANPAKRDALLADAGLSDLARHPARRLSGGQQQRLALARALATDPEVLLLDEPTTGLDPASVMSFERIVQLAKAGGTKIIFVTHDIGQARRLADEVVFLSAGRITEHRPAPDFFDAPTSPEARAYLSGALWPDSTTKLDTQN